MLFRSDKTHRPDGRPAGRHSGGFGITELNAQVVLSMSPGPGSATSRPYQRGGNRKGDAIPGDRRQEARASTGQKAGSSESGGRLNDWKQLRLEKVGDRKALRRRKVQGKEGASRKDPKGGTGASPGSRRQSRRKQAKPGGRKTSIKKAGVEVPRPEPRSREAEEPD